jgi:hypothetical protein
LGNAARSAAESAKFSDPHIPPAHRQQMQHRWDALQKSFLQLSSTATQSFVKHSGHFIQRDDPQAIVDVIRAMVTAPGFSQRGLA